MTVVLGCLKCSLVLGYALLTSATAVFMKKADIPAAARGQ